MQIFDGYGGRVRLDDQGWMHLEPSGPMRRLRPAKAIPLTSVVGAHLVRAKLFRNGSLQIILADDPDPPLRNVGPNSLMFLHQHNAEFSALRDWLEQVATINLASASARGVPSSSHAVPTTSTQSPQTEISAATDPTMPPQNLARTLPQSANVQTPLRRPRADIVAEPSTAAKDATFAAIQRIRDVARSPLQQSAPAARGLDQSGKKLASLLSASDRIAVIDVETTGLYSNDRVVEVAVVTLDRHGQIVDEFESLVNPLRDPGPTWLHGLTPTALRDAPTFEDIAEHLAALLDGAVVAAHNLPFDRRLLTYEFDRARVDIEWGEGLDTLPASGGRKLALACSNYGIDLRDAHRALSDARATAKLVLEVISEFHTCRPAAAYPTSSALPPSLTRDGVTQAETARPYVLELARNLRFAPDIADYVGLLDYAVADLKLEPRERAELAALAAELGLSRQDRVRAHRQFLNGLLEAAIETGVVDDADFDKLCCVAALLEVDDAVVRSRVDPLRTATELFELDAGMGICFTGGAVSEAGEKLEREDLIMLARRHALEPVDSVTKSECHLLVAADLSTMSRKAKAARKFGIPIASASKFQTSLAGRTTLTVERISASKVGLVCAECGQAWMATRRPSLSVCDSCREAARPQRTRDDYQGPRLGGPGQNAANTTERLDRLERCRQAVCLQRNGASRDQIARELGLSLETVKALLRDGKFYAAPDSDSERLHLARRAARARAEGQTRAAFAELAGLSKGRAEECWRDSDVLFDTNEPPLPATSESYV